MQQAHTRLAHGRSPLPEPWGIPVPGALANVMFTNELARRLQTTTFTADALHPGMSGSTQSQAICVRARDAGLSVQSSTVNAFDGDSTRG